MARARKRVKKQLHQIHHLSCDSSPRDIRLLWCAAVSYLCVCSCTLFCTCLKARVACVCVFGLHAAVIKKTHQHRPQFSSLFDAFKMLITSLLCATSNANVLFYGREVGPTFCICISYFLSP